MFSSPSSINPFANYPSPYLHFPPLFAGYDNNEVSINHQHNPFTGLLLPDSPRIPESLTNMALTGNNATMIKQDFDSLNAEYHDASKFAPCSKKPVKKDRHSKICTSQGLRDRRVRLSIAISRQFFDLQDMLGFDKASKTLGWLLNKSRNAIKELAELKSTGNIGSAKRKVMYENGDLEGNDSRSRLMEKTSEEKKMEKLHNTALLLAKESRDKARARARQRTIQKMCRRRLHEYSKKVPDTLIQFRSLSQFKACQASSSSAHNFASSLNVVSEVKEQFFSHELASKAPMEEVSEQGSNSNVLKGKQNLEIANDLSCNTSNYNVNLPQNWDMINSAMPQYSPFRAITTNTNFSAGLQIYGKTCWEARNSMSYR